MSRHAPGHGVDRELHLHALLGQRVEHLPHRVLGLGDGHAIAGHDDDLLRVLEEIGGILGRAPLDGLLLLLFGRHGHLAEASHDHGQEGTVHRPAHDVGENGAGRADKGPGDDEHGVVEGEADARCGPAGIAVEHRDHHRHVRAADGNDEQDAEREGENRHEEEDETVFARHEQREQQQDREPDAGVDEVAAGKEDRLRAHEQAEDLEHRLRDALLDVAGEAGLKFPPGDHRAREGDRADDRAEAHLEQGGGLDAVLAENAEIGGLQERRRGHEHRREAHEGVKGGDELRHRRHLDALGDHHPDRTARGDRDQDEEIAPPGAARKNEQGDDDGQRHAGHAVQVARPGGGRMGEAAQRENEADGAQEIAEGGDVGTHAPSSLSRVCGTWRACAR